MINALVEIHFKQIYRDWDNFSIEKKQSFINRSRNYIRFKMTKPDKHHIPSNHPLLTPEEQSIVLQINATRQQLKNLQCAFYSNFYENCGKVGSTLKRKVLKIDNLSLIDDTTNLF